MQWQWQATGKKWVPFEPEQQQAIEHALKREPHKVTLQLGKKQYTCWPADGVMDVVDPPSELPIKVQKAKLVPFSGLVAATMPADDAAAVGTGGVATGAAAAERAKPLPHDPAGLVA